MSVTAIAPPLSLLGPVPQEPPHSLLALLRKLGDGSLVEGGRIAGAGVWFSPCVLPSPHDPCAEGTFRDKDEGEDAGATATFEPFTAYVPMICASYPAARDWEGFEKRLRQAFRARESHAVEVELVSGSALATANPHLGDANVTKPAADTAQTAGVALSYLEEQIAASAVRGLIWATPAVVAALQAIPFGDVQEIDETILQTANGNYIVSSTGLVAAEANGTAPGATESWMFASGPVVVHRGEETRFTLEESLDRSDNTLVVRVERDYFATFDPCVQAAVLVDWTT